MLKLSRGIWRGALLFFCQMSWEGQALGQVKEIATHRDRMALPPDAVFEATLEDVSRTDVPAEVIGQVHIDLPSNPPFRFEITYDPAQVIASHRYMVRVRILVSGQLFFTTDQSYPVLTVGHGKEVALLLRRAGCSGPVGGGTAPLGTLPATFSTRRRGASSRSLTAGPWPGRGWHSSGSIPGSAAWVFSPTRH
jgi:uncharacterized lipoprotein YbaY